MAPVTPNAVTRTLLAPSAVPAAGSEYVAVTDHPLLDPVASVTVSTVAPAALDHAPGVGARPTLAPVPAMTSVPGATVATSVSITLPVPAPADAAPAPPITTARVAARRAVRRMTCPSSRVGWSCHVSPPNRPSHIDIAGGHRLIRND